MRTGGKAMSIHYEVIATRQADVDIGAYTGYDIVAADGEECPARAENVFTDDHQARYIAALLTAECVEPVHLMDVMYNSLSGEQT